MTPPSGFPVPADPVDWIRDKVGDIVGGTVGKGFEFIVHGISSWVLGAVAWVVGGVFNFFTDATDPNVQADWFITGHGPYATTVAIGATLLVGFVLIGITQSVVAGDVAGMLRRMIVDLPLCVLGMVGLVTVTQALIRLTDVLASDVLDTFVEDSKEFVAAVVALTSLAPGVSTTFVIVVLAVVTVLAGIVVVAELVIRAALVYIVVALAPLVFAAHMWPALRGASRKLLDLLVALIVSKLVIAIALGIGAAAAVGTGSGGEVTALPAPEVIAEDPGGSVTQAVGLLLAATAAFGVAAFSPLLVVKLLPVAEAALVAQGIRGGPVRAAQQAVSIGYYTRYLHGGSRAAQLASGRTPGDDSSKGGPPGPSGGTPGSGPKGPPAGTGGSAGGAGAAGAAAGGSAAAGVAAADAAKKVAGKGAQAMTGTATGAADRPTASGPAPAYGPPEGKPASTDLRRPPGGEPTPGGGGGRGRTP